MTDRMRLRRNGSDSDGKAASIVAGLRSGASASLAAWMDANSRKVLGAVEGAIERVAVAAYRLDIHALREKVGQLEGVLEEARAAEKAAREEYTKEKTDTPRLRAAITVADAKLFALRSRGTTGSKGLPFTVDEVAAIRLALTAKSHSDADRTKAMQAFNNFHGRIKRNPGVVDAIHEIQELQRKVEDLNWQIDAARRMTIEFGEDAARCKAVNEPLREELARLERQIETESQLQPASGDMTREEINLLRLALHPDRTPSDAELQKALVAFDAYVARTGGAVSGSVWSESRRRSAEEERQERERQYERQYEEEQREREQEEQREREQKERRRQAREEGARKRESEGAYSARVQERIRLGNFKVGDILTGKYVSSLAINYGMSESVFFFFLSVGGRAKSVTSVLLRSDTIFGGYGWRGAAVPIDGEHAGRPVKQHVDVRENLICAKGRECTLFLWDGKPVPNVG